MNKLALIAATAVLTLAGNPAVAATKAATKAPAKTAAPAAAAPAGGNAQEEHAMLYLKVLISGLQSDKVEQPVKGAIVGCLYDNSLGKITESMDKVIAENPGKISRDNPSELLAVMAQICGYRPQPGAAAPAAPAPSPTAKPTGR